MPRSRSASPYQAAQLRARARLGALRLEAGRRILAALRAYAEELTRRVARLTGTRQLMAAKAREAVVALQRDLQRALEVAVREGRDLAFAEVTAIQARATRLMAEGRVVPLQPRLTQAAAFERVHRGAGTWRTLLRGHVDRAQADAQRVVTEALLQGMSPQELSRRLRPYVVGSQRWQRAFAKSGEISDRMLRDPTFTKEANRLRYNADRIAFSEIQNARRAAEAAAFHDDPFVKAVRWTLSPLRGTQDRPDACDVLAKTDFYGLGKGVYPVAKVPSAPHPFDRCELEPVPWDDPERDLHNVKPDPLRRVVGSARLPGLTQAQAARALSGALASL